MNVDVLLICALKDEYNQVCKVTDGILGSGWIENIGPKGWTVADATFRTASGTNLSIRATWADHMGRESTQAVASMLIHEQPARCIAMSGICGGRRDKLTLGDVIFAERMWSYDTGKTIIENDEEHFQGDPLQYKVKPVWVQRMQQITIDPNTPWLIERPIPTLEYQEDWVLLRILANEDPTNHEDFSNECPNWDDILKRLWKRNWLNDSLELTTQGHVQASRLKQLYPHTLPSSSHFQVHVAPIGTGATVTEDSGIFPRLANSMRKVLGIEMEASAMAALGEILDIPVIIAKGVSDYGDPFKDDRYRDFSARASAECLINLLRNSVDLLPEKTSTTEATYSSSGRKTNISHDLIQLFAEAYPDVRDARALWQRAGGQASEIENIPRPRDLWQRLWQHCQQGASVSPMALLQAALEDLPNNMILTQYLVEANENKL